MRAYFSFARAWIDVCVCCVIVSLCHYVVWNYQFRVLLFIFSIMYFLWKMILKMDCSIFVDVIWYIDDYVTWVFWWCQLNWYIYVSLYGIALWRNYVYPLIVRMIWINLFLFIDQILYYIISNFKFGLFVNLCVSNGFGWFDVSCGLYVKYRWIWNAPCILYWYVYWMKCINFVCVLLLCAMNVFWFNCLSLVIFKWLDLYFQLFSFDLYIYKKMYCLFL